VDKDFGEEDVANKVDSNESIEQEIRVVKEKINRQMIFQPSKNVLFLFVF
jgi:ribosomal protein S21